MEGRQLEWLGRTAKDTSISITDSGVRIKQVAADILDAYTKVGSQRPELLANKEALHDVTTNAIILSEAAKSKLEPAVKGLTMAMNQHNLGATESARVINAMAAGSKLGAADIPYLTAAIEKSGTTLNLMNINLEENIALIETIAPSYSEASMAGNSLDKTFLMMKAQGIGFKNGIFDISTALEELKLRFDGDETAVDLFGLRHAKMASILVKNRGNFIKFRDGVTGTTVAIEQAGKNTDNVAARLAQAQNRMKLRMIAFGEVISPVFLKSTNAVTYLIKALVVLPKFIRDNQVVILSLAGAIMAYNAVLVTSIALTIKASIVKKLAVMWDTALVVVSTARVTAMQIQILFMRKSTAAQLLNVAAVKKAILMQKLFGKALMANPIGLAIAAVFALVIAIKSYDKYSKQAIEREKEKKKALDELTGVNEIYSEQLDKFAKQTQNLNRLSLQRKKELKNEIALNLEMAEKVLLLQEARQLEIQAQNSQATLWQKTTNIMKAGGNAYLAAAYNVASGVKNGADAANEMTDGLEALKEKIDLLKQQDTTLYDLLNAEKIGDEIGTGSLIEMEEKLQQYQTALRNVIAGSEDYIRVQLKIKNLEATIAQARKDNAVVEEETAKNKKAAADKIIKEKIEAVKAWHNLEMAEIRKNHLENKTNEDEYNAQLLKQEILFQQKQMEVYTVGSKGYAKAYNESLSLQVEADLKIKKLLLKAQEVLSEAQIANLHEGVQKEIAILDNKWEIEKAELQKQLIEKENLSQQEIELNEVLNQTLIEKKAEHLLKIKQLEEANNIAELENLVTALDPVDGFQIDLDKIEAFHEAKRNLFEAQYKIEQKLAAGNQSALLAAETRYKKAVIDNKTSLVDAEWGLIETKIDNSQSYVKSLQGLFSKESAMGKALFLFNQGLAIAEIWVNTAKANAKAVASSPLTFGQPWVTVNTLQAAAGTAMVIKQTVGQVTEFATGKYPVQGESGNSYNANFASKPQTGIYNGPQLGIFNEVPGQPEIVIDGITAKKINVNHPEILEAIYNVRDGKLPQFETGYYPLASLDTTLTEDKFNEGNQSSSDSQLINLIEQNTAAMQELKNLTVIASIETIERERNNFIKIKSTTGL